MYKVLVTSGLNFYLKSVVSPQKISPVPYRFISQEVVKYTHRSFNLDEKPISSFLDLVDVGEHLITCDERNSFSFCNNQNAMNSRRH